MERQVQSAQVLWEATQALQEAEDLEGALAASLETLIHTLGCEAGSIWLLDRTSDRLFPSFNHGPVDISGITIANGQGIAGSVVKEGSSVIVEDTAADPRFSRSVDDESGFVTRSMICVPLKNAYETIGCIQVINRLDGSHYTTDDLYLCEQLAALATIAIDERGLVPLAGPERRVLVRLHDAVKEFATPVGPRRVLKGINLDIYEGELMVVLGESGCGKTTLLNVIGGMDELTEGTLTVDGRDFTRPTPAQLTAYRRDWIGYVFQAYHLMPNLSALENIEFVTEICANSLPATEVLARVGLADQAMSLPAQLSGGQQQRVCIARALAKNPRLILADEPTAALDVATSLDVLAIMEDIVRERHKTVVLITHNPEIAKMADRVVRLREGRVSSIRVNRHPRHARELSW